MRWLCGTFRGTGDKVQNRRCAAGLFVDEELRERSPAASWYVMGVRGRAGSRWAPEVLGLAAPRQCSAGTTDTPPAEAVDFESEALLGVTPTATVAYATVSIAAPRALAPASRKLVGGSRATSSAGTNHTKSS